MWCLAPQLGTAKSWLQEIPQKHAVRMALLEQESMIQIACKWRNKQNLMKNNKMGKKNKTQIKTKYIRKKKLFF